MAMRLSVLCLLASLSLVFCADPPTILVHKRVSSKIVAEDVPVVITYNILNVGTRPVYNFLLEDDSWPSDQFEILNGTTWTKIKSIESQGKETHILTVRPLSTAPILGPRAKFHYSFEKTGSHYQTGYSTDLPAHTVLTKRQYKMQSSWNLTEWGVFFGVGSIFIVVPLLSWLKAQAQYHSLTAPAKKSS
eukprot:GILK01009997.1.p1 GENE.GILK01009997.1~~GILK01009997.1.p1  ORF type:complete len:203 (+),score=17.66 GILK01009997.1:40-609(+)